MGIIAPVRSTPLGGLVDRRIALAIVTLAICGALWAAFSRVGGGPDERVAASTMLLSDLPGHYLATSSNGPCHFNIGNSVPVLLVQVRAEPSGQASIYLNTVNWPMMPDRPRDSTSEPASASEPGGGLALHFHSMMLRPSRVWWGPMVRRGRHRGALSIAPTKLFASAMRIPSALHCSGPKIRRS